MRKLFQFLPTPLLFFGTFSASAQPIRWEPIPPLPPIETINQVRTKDSLVWEPLNQTSSAKSQQDPEWQILPGDSESTSSSHKLVWIQIDDPFLHENIALEQPKASPTTKFLTPPPSLQALDRSIAFGNDLVGPDISWNVPNGLRWSERWFGSASLLGQSRRQNNGPFYKWNGGDAVAIVHANILQAGSWSVGLNTSFRSVYQGDQSAGGSTQVGEGISSGFRIATAIGDTGGIAFGGEQVLQWDDRTDTGRNLYLMATKGWWLGNQGTDYPLLVANGGFGTGRFANQDILSWKNPLRFACVDGFEDRQGTFSVDNDLCWSPIGTVSLVLNDYIGTFVEYRSGTAQAAASVSLSDGIPLRFTWGVNFAGKNEVLKTNQWTWVFRASLGF
ncbi:hypothetical protein Syn8016DRAFT_1717 [Synechococcus sp. WH 8016]|nr:hypothetical protein Syn8016DRAFT_1717 [Synechococcus sp. WH 8016]